MIQDVETSFPQNQNPEFRNNMLVSLSQICVHSEIRRMMVHPNFGAVNV